MIVLTAASDSVCVTLVFNSFLLNHEEMQVVPLITNDGPLEQFNFNSKQSQNQQEYKAQLVCNDDKYDLELANRVRQ